MRTLYLDCTMGVTCQMLASALLDLQDDPEGALGALNRSAGIHYLYEKKGSRGARLWMDQPGSLTADTIRQAAESLSPEILSHMEKMLPAAEQAAADEREDLAYAAPACLLAGRLYPDAILSSPICIRMNHTGLFLESLSKEARADLRFFTDVAETGSLCTAAGISLIRELAGTCGDMPVLQICRLGSGLASDSSRPDLCVHAVLGELAERAGRALELSFNVDDMTGEEISDAVNRIYAAGAGDVFTESVYMKKNRPGILFCVSAAESDREKILAAIFHYTTTIGVRETVQARYVMDRSITRQDTVFGPIHVKKATGYGTVKEKIEFDDLSRIADETGLSIRTIKGEICQTGKHRTEK